MKNCTIDLRLKCEFEEAKLGSTRKIIIQLARLLLLNPKLILISNDFFTKRDDFDSYIMNVIKKNFSDSCVVGVVDQYDLLHNFSHVIGMDRGQIKEMGKARILLENTNSFLNKQIQNKQKRDSQLTERIRNTLELRISTLK